MGINQIVEQQYAGHAAGAKPMGSQHGVSREQQQSGALPTPQTTNSGPSIRWSSGGSQVVLDTTTLVFYGVVLADLLLLYIAMRV